MSNLPDPPGRVSGTPGAPHPTLQDQPEAGRSQNAHRWRDGYSLLKGNAPQRWPRPALCEPHHAALHLGERVQNVPVWLWFPCPPAPGPVDSGWRTRPGFGPSWPCCRAWGRGDSTRLPCGSDGVLSLVHGAGRRPRQRGRCPHPEGRSSKGREGRVLEDRWAIVSIITSGHGGSPSRWGHSWALVLSPLPPPLPEFASR